MIKLRIDNIEVEVKDGASILESAIKAGVEIPAMCYYKGFEHNNTCMVCLVKNNKSGKIIPSCSAKAENGMDIDTRCEEIKKVRKEGLELLLSDHIGDCEAPCTLACPANMDIPLMNRLIGEGKYREALIVVKKDIALPAILGYICPAPCEKACKRKPIDDSVSICRLKRFVAEDDLDSESPYLSEKANDSGKKVAIIGAGPAGLSAAYYILQHGHACTIFDKNNKAGGAIRYHIGEDLLPVAVLDGEIKLIEKLGAEFMMNTFIDENFYQEKIQSQFDAVVLTTGTEKEFIINIEKSNSGIKVDPKTFGTSQKGVFAGGNAIREGKMAIRSIAHGKSIAHSVHLYLNNLPVAGINKAFNSLFGALKLEEFEEYLKEATKDPRTQKENILDGFLAGEAEREAVRCMHCDCRKKDNCLLRDYSTEYAADRRKYWPEQRNMVRKNVQQGIVIYEPEKCIKCNICIQITEKAGEELGLGYVGRGFDVEVCVPFQGSIDEGIKKVAEECIRACPTGALARFKK
jgi:ferredoxin